MKDLTQNNQLKKIGDICDLKKGTSITKNKITDGTIPVIAGGKQPAYYHKIFNRSGKTITISASGANAGFINYFEIPIFASDCITIQSLDENNVLTKFIYIMLKSKQKMIYKLQTGAGQPHVYARDLIKIKLPVPPLVVQKQIVSLLERAENLKQKRQQTNEETSKLLQSIFLEMFGDPINNKKGWTIKRISDVCVTSSGGTPSRAKQEYYIGKIPWIKSGEVNNLIVEKAEEHISEEALKNSSARYIEPNSVLVAMYGATAGKSALLKIKATINQAICALVSKENNLHSWYLLYYFRLIEKKLVSLSIGGGQPNISQQIIKQQLIPVPPLELQNKFASIVEKVEKLREKQRQSTKEIGTLFDALLQKAFNGELVA